jgi:tetratricopeptide (TPR) repeat protein
MSTIQLQQKLEKARAFLIRQDFVQALPRYEKLVRQWPQDAVVWFEYGNAAAGVRNRELAERAWQMVLELAPRNAELILQVGHQYQALRIPDKARSCFAQAAAADPRAINPRISLAVLSEQNHLLQPARAAIEECLAIDPHDDQARYFSAVLDRRENKQGQAESRLRDLIASAPGHPYVRYACRFELAQVLDRTERFDEAMRLLVEAKQIVKSLTDIEALRRSYDQEADSARRFTQCLPKTILGTWAKAHSDP